MRRFIIITLLCAGVLLEFGWRREDGPRPQGDEAREDAASGAAPDEAATEAGKLDVCAQLTREEVEAALGRPVREPVRGTELTSRRAGTVTSSCMFGSDEGFVSVGVRRQYPSSATAWNAAKSYDELKERITAGEYSGKLIEVSGVGVDAFAETKEETKNYETTELRALAERSILTVRVVGPSATPTLEAARTLAATVIPRLDMLPEDAPPPKPRPTPSTPGRGANSNGGEAAGEADKSRNENKDAKGAARAEAGKNSAAARKSNSRAGDEPGAGDTRKSARETAKKTADRNNKQAARAPAAKPRGKKRT